MCFCLWWFMFMSAVPTTARRACEAQVSSLVWVLGHKLASPEECQVLLTTE